MKPPPQTDQIEVTVFGPGYGECIVVHIGDGRWIIVDSCKVKRGSQPVALQYFDQIGVNASTQVELIIITHWHDDHIRGAAELVDSCPNAGLCFSEAFTEDEFLRFLSVYSSTKMSSHGTGVDEFTAILEKIKEPARKIYRGGQDKRILNLPGADLSHGHPCEVWTLSPSGFQVTESEARFATLIPEAQETMRRAVPGGQNNHSVAAWISIGDENIVLGADLETTKDVRAGWDSVLNSKNRPNGAVGLFKVPHHGSETGHHVGLWASVLRKDVNAIVTPWNRSQGLPRKEDMDRLTGQTKNLYLTSQPSALFRARHEHDVERMMRQFGIKTKRHSNSVGAVTARLVPSDDGEWDVSSWALD